jgi:hypothetical protein
MPGACLVDGDVDAIRMEVAVTVHSIDLLDTVATRQAEKWIASLRSQ